MLVEHKKAILNLVNFCNTGDNQPEWEETMGHWETWAFGILDFSRVAGTKSRSHYEPGISRLKNLGLEIYMATNTTWHEDIKKNVLEMASILTTEYGYDYGNLLNSLKETDGY